MLQELAEERSGNSTLLLSRDEIDRVLMARLLDPPADYPQWPLHYLLGCYARCAGLLCSASCSSVTLSARRMPCNLGVSRHDEPQHCSAHVGPLQHGGMQALAPDCV